MHATNADYRRLPEPTNSPSSHPDIIGNPFFGMWRITWDNAHHLAASCAMLAQLSLIMTMFVLSDKVPLEQRLLLGKGDISMEKCIFKLTLWILSTGFAGLFGGIIFRLRSPGKFGLALASIFSSTFFGWVFCRNADLLCSQMAFGRYDEVSFGRQWALFGVFSVSFGISFGIIVTYLLEKAFANCEGPEDPEKNIGTL